MMRLAINSIKSIIFQKVQIRKVSNYKNSFFCAELNNNKIDLSLMLIINMIKDTSGGFGD